MSEERAHVSPSDEKTVLIVDDDRDIGEILQQIIVDQTDYKVVWIAESDLVLDAASYMRPSLLILDYMLPTIDGLHLYDRLQTIDSMRGVPTVLISASPTLPFDKLRSRGIYLLHKPFELDELKATARYLVALDGEAQPAAHGLLPPPRGNPLPHGGGRRLVRWLVDGHGWLHRHGRLHRHRRRDGRSALRSDGRRGELVARRR